MARIICVGEGMLELSQAAGADSEHGAEPGWRLGYGGDTLNTAIHLARAGNGQRHDVRYLTALGADPFSARLRAQWQAEGIDCDLVLTHPERQAGLYAITTDDAGERSFTYWREASAARAMFALPAMDAALALAAGADLLFFSLISLAILPAAGRERLLALARTVRERGGRVAFDGNYRPKLWASPQEAAAARDSAIAVATIGLPTLDDERQIAGATDADEVARHWAALGCGETIVKLGAEGCRLPDGALIAPAAIISPVDTSGAGDAFNAGYLDARLSRAPIAEAARAGHALAGWTIQRRGAIPPRDAALP